ncbi:hypothetical protein PVAND_005128 [Polypedilum vanderplanki]|uniref:Uncharacterized protein n=1 Tax=Polypedilum vanderplanki TaxID=319348 RepID=A0A9J6BZ84_POLVA|nr:hypothetical protein PVAND_005128 [Polypedilum vanderplanki]
MSEDPNKIRREKVKKEEEQKRKSIELLSAASQVYYESNELLFQHYNQILQIQPRSSQTKSESWSSSENQPRSSQKVSKDDTKLSKEKSTDKSQKDEAK